MGNLLAYSGIVTKVRAMQAQLLTPAQYEELSALSSVSEIVEYLSRLPSYRDWFSGRSTKDFCTAEILKKS